MNFEKKQITKQNQSITLLIEWIQRAVNLQQQLVLSIFNEYTSFGTNKSFSKGEDIMIEVVGLPMPSLYEARRTDAAMIRLDNTTYYGNQHSCKQVYTYTPSIGPKPLPGLSGRLVSLSVSRSLVESSEHGIGSVAFLSALPRNEEKILFFPAINETATSVLGGVSVCNNEGEKSGSYSYSYFAVTSRSG